MAAIDGRDGRRYYPGVMRIELVGGGEVVRLAPVGPLQNNVYVICAPEAGVAAVVDPGLEAMRPVTAALAQRTLPLELIIATHGHWDHVAEAGPLAEESGAGVAAHGMDAEMLRKPAQPMMFPGMVIPPAEVTQELAEGDTVEVGEVRLRVLHTPGHTPGSICLLHEASGVLLSGDTLFAGSYGRYDLPGGDVRRLMESLQRLSELPPETQVLPGHGSGTTIGRESWLYRPPG